MASSDEKKVNKTEKSDMAMLPLGKTNFVLIGVCIVLIVVGFAMMHGRSNQGATFNGDIFNSTRTVVAPFITFVGFVLMVVAIMFKGKKK